MEVDEANVAIVTSYITPVAFVFTNIFRDQMDRYGEIYTTYEKILKGVRMAPKATIIANGDEQLFNTQNLPNPVIYYGFNHEHHDDLRAPANTDGLLCPKCQHILHYHLITYAGLGDYFCPHCGFKRPKLDYAVTKLGKLTPTSSTFELDGQEYRIEIGGLYNIYNALAMCAVCRFAGLTVEQCAAAAASFKGAGRRFEVYGECNGAVVVDDYAHHPTELRATLNTAKEMGYKRLIAVHQPFTYSRTKMLFNDFVDVLKIPDVAVITPIMGSREPNDPTITSAKLAAQIPGSVLVDSLEAAADWVKQNAREGDLVITLGCGDIYKAGKMMVADNNK